MLTLRQLSFDVDDSSAHMELRASNGQLSTTQDFYCYPDDVRSFGEQLVDFPRDLSHEARWEIGSSDSEWAYHIWLRAYVHDSVGHTALEIHVDNHAVAPYRHLSDFSIVCEAAALNRLGRMLVAWDREGALEWKALA